MSGKSIDYRDIDTDYRRDIDEADFNVDYPMRRIARILAYSTAFVMSYLAAIVAVFYIATWIKG